MARGLERPSWWWSALIVAGAVYLIVGVVVTWDRGRTPASVLEADEASQAAERASETAEREAALAAQEARIDIAALGDSYTGGSDMDSGDGFRWHELLTEQYPWNVTPYAVGGTGFVSGEDAGTEFAARVPEIVAAQPDVVVVTGGHNDEQYPVDRVEDAARQVLTDLRAGLPEARIVVVGVLWAGDPPAGVERIDEALEGLAGEVGGTFVEALGEGWFSGPNEALIGSDGIHPTDEGHAALAQRISAALIAAGVPESVTP